MIDFFPENGIIDAGQIFFSKIYGQIKTGK